MAHLDVQTDLVARLGAALPCPVRAFRASGDRPPLVTVRREGGRFLDALRDRPGVGIYCWGPSEAAACALAHDVAAAMGRLVFAQGYDSVEMDSMRSDPDPDTSERRWYLSHTLVTHEPPKD